jgi:hypothetical protein
MKLLPMRLKAVAKNMLTEDMAKIDMNHNGLRKVLTNTEVKLNIDK